jgi:hypothetical protein
MRSLAIPALRPGERDARWTRRPRRRALRRFLPRARLRLLEGQGHVVTDTATIALPFLLETPEPRVLDTGAAKWRSSIRGRAFQGNRTCWTRWRRWAIWLLRHDRAGGEPGEAFFDLKTRVAGEMLQKFQIIQCGSRWS